MKRSRKLLAGVVAVGLVASLGACASGGGGTEGGGVAPTTAENCKNTIKDGVPTVTVWAWYPYFDAVVDVFNEKNGDVQVCWIDAGASADEYAKFNVTLEAGNGAPDVIMIEGDMMPGYILRGAFEDISEFGANDINGNFTEGTWGQISIGDAVYAIPVDAGPMGMYYRQDIYDEYGISVPTTWKEFAAAAEQMKDAGAEGFLANWQTNNPAFSFALLAQNGWAPFSFDISKPDEVSVNIDTEEGTEVINYWFDLIGRGLISADDRGTTDWQRNLITGKYATYVAPAWGNKNIEGIEGSDPNAQWRAAPLPQWDPENPVVTNWGGSNFAVTTQAPDKELAAQVAMGLFSDEESWKIGVEDVLFFPAYLPILESDYFSGLAKPFYGDQKMNEEVWVPAARSVERFTYGPTTQFTYNVMIETLNDMLQGNIQPDDVLATVEDRVVEDLETQGFTVTVN